MRKRTYRVDRPKTITNQMSVDFDYIVKNRKIGLNSFQILFYTHDGTYGIRIHIHFSILNSISNIIEEVFLRFCTVKVFIDSR